ncbi:IS110 family transposase [Proteinivorax tanatarense]|uniref:IS110 family transposase n=1 Tax=Proteinivorax tanatarense TaxID=1260629 RepID=A0AAU7VQP8_9FIRM
MIRELDKVFKFYNSEEGFYRFYSWLEKIKDRTNKTDIIVGAEPTGHYWFSLGESLKKNKIKLVLVNPFHVKRSKELDDNHPSKTDAKDPKTIAKLVIEGRFNEPYMPEGVYAELRTATVNRIRITKELSMIKNRIERWIKCCFPEYSKVFKAFDGVASLIILETSPLPKDLVELGAEGINQLWRQRKIRAIGIKRATSLYNAAKSSIGVTQGLEAARFELKMLLEDYHNKSKQYEIILEMIERLCAEIPGVDKILEIKGIGLVTISSFLGEVGDIRRFDSPKQIQKLAGLALKESSSGKHKGQTTISKRGRKRLRAILFQATMPLVGKNKEFGSIHHYYTTRVHNPLKKKQSIIAICCKLIRVLFAILTKNEEYSAQRLIADIKRPSIQLAA